MKIYMINRCLLPNIISLLCRGILLFYAATGLSVSANPDSGEILPTRNELIDNFRANRQALIVYGASASEFVERYKTTLTNFQQQSRWMQVELKSDQEVSVGDLAEKTVYLIGSVRSNRLLKDLHQRLPVRFSNEGIHLRQKVYGDAQDQLTFYYPNPHNSNYAINILAANDDERLLRHLEANPRFLFNSIGDYRIVRDDRCLVFGFFSQEAKDRWQFDPANHRDFEAQAITTLDTDNYRFHFHKSFLAAAEMKKIATAQEERLQTAHRLLQSSANTGKINYHVYPNFEDKGLMIRNTDFSSANVARNEVHTVIRPDIRGNDFSQDVRILLHQSLGQPARKMLEVGMSIYLSDQWREKGYEYWASRLYLSGNACLLPDMLDNNRFKQESQLVMAPMAGTFIAYALEEWGIEAFIENYNTWQPPESEWASLQAGWYGYLDRLSEKYRQQIESDRKNFQGMAGFQKGFCHAHEGYRIYNGYISKKSDQALAKLNTIGVNAVSITPFSYMRNPNKPVFLNYSRDAGSENDESVIHAALAAKSLDMAVMMKPHIWLGRSWPGDIEMTNTHDWDLFFDYYYRWIRHYALLSEMYEVESLCIGVELAKATVGNEDRWQRLVRRIRGLYSGTLTYAANWGDEFENVSFWKELDYIGVNSYYPLSKDTSATDAELLDGAKAVVAKIESIQQKYNKPVYFTEIGFTSTQSPWLQPHETARRKPLNLQDQARCYNAIFLALENKDWCQGLFWWKWPSFLEYGGMRDNDFTPNGKPAEAVLRKWYGKKW